MLSCSRPDTHSLLAALQPVFKLRPIRPVVNISTTTNVTIDFIMFGILGVYWKNEFVTWDPEECGARQITVPRKLLWVPDMVINEFMEKNSAPFVPYSYLYSDGLVLDAQPVRVVSSCRLDIYLFPFDIQNCSLSFNSYLHGSAMQLEILTSAEEIFRYSKEVMTTMGEWELIGLTAKKLEPTSTIDDSGHYVTVRRRATLYVVNLLIPSCFLITVDLFSFMLPPKDVDRSLFKMTLILGYTVFLIIMNDLLPITGETIPLLNVFLSLCLGLMVASLLETILITNLMCGSTHYSPVPRWIRVLVLQILGKLVRLPPNEAPEEKGPLCEDEALQELKNLSSDLQAVRLQVEQQLNGSPSSEEWIQVGSVIDRLLFILYILFITVSFITIIIIWVIFYNNP
uniref:Uncharacterized protein n=1 Tax=Acanthochromis polyacanthus TaxID=80966 RepID=A0A3Q1EPQ6_9TELE